MKKVLFLLCVCTATSTLLQTNLYATAAPLDPDNDPVEQATMHGSGEKKRYRPEKKCPCTFSPCKFVGVSKWDLARHMRTHTGERPFPCSVCGFCFIDRSNKNNHERKCKGGRPRPKPIRYRRTYPSTQQLSTDDASADASAEAGGGSGAAGLASQAEASGLTLGVGDFYWPFDPSTQQLPTDDASAEAGGGSGATGLAAPTEDASGHASSEGGHYFDWLFAPDSPTANLLSSAGSVTLYASSQKPAAQVNNAEEEDTGLEINFFYCDKCSYRTQKRSESERHKKSHSSEKHFFCHYCNNGYKHTWDLARHMRTHTGERPFPCSICGFCFTDCSNRNNHKRNCTGVPPQQKPTQYRRTYPSTQQLSTDDASADASAEAGGGSGAAGLASQAEASGLTLGVGDFYWPFDPSTQQLPTDDASAEAGGGSGAAGLAAPTEDASGHAAAEGGHYFDWLFAPESPTAKLHLSPEELAAFILDKKIPGEHDA